MFLEYKLKLRIIIDILTNKTTKIINSDGICDFASKALSIESKDTAGNVLRGYLKGSRTPTEDKLRNICNNLNISYLFVTNHNLILSQDERIMIDFLWYELNDKDEEVSTGLWSAKSNLYLNTTNQGRTKYFNVTSPKLNKYMMEFTQLKLDCADSTDWSNYYNYILNFPYSSEYFNESEINTNTNVSKSKLNYINKDSFIRSMLNGTVSDNDVDTVINSDTSPVLNINYKLKYLKNLGALEGPFTLVRDDDNYDREAKIFDTPFTLQQAINLEKYVGYPINYVLDLYSTKTDIYYALIDGIVWNDLFKETSTIKENIDTIPIKNPKYNIDYEPGCDLFFVDDSYLNDMLNDYFTIKDQYSHMFRLGSKGEWQILSDHDYIQKLLSITSKRTKTKLIDLIIMSDLNKSRHNR